MTLLQELFAQTKITAGEIGAPTVSVNSTTLNGALSLVYFVAGIVCVVMIIIGGVRYVTSQGDQGGIASAKNTILYSVIGIVVILLAAAITQLIFQTL